jgi:glutathione S-transferase
LPLYEEPGLVLVQANAITRYLANKHGYNGANDKEAALIDQANEGVGDAFADVFIVLYWTPTEQKAEAKEKLLKENLPKHFGFFTALLEKNGNNGYLVGSKLSYADLRLWSLVQYTCTNLEISRDILLEAFPSLKKHSDGVAERERIKAYLARDDYKQ